MVVVPKPGRIPGRGRYNQYQATGEGNPVRTKTGLRALLGKALSGISELAVELRALRARVGRVLGSPDGRWAVVSTTMTASVAVAVTWLSLAANPANTARAYEPRREQATLPYDLLLRLTGLRGVPSIAAGKFGAALSRSGSHRAGHHRALDRMLASEREAVKPQPEIRTLTVDRGDTIVGMLQEAGFRKSMRPRSSTR
jgi:hypothetical protein